MIKKNRVRRCTCGCAHYNALGRIHGLTSFIPVIHACVCCVSVRMDFPVL